VAARSDLPYRFTYSAKLRVDLLPSSKRYLDEGSITFAQTGQVMNLTGFDLALQHHVEIALPGGNTVSVATAPVIVVLKMAAFLDRPWDRERDLQDLAAVLLQYLEPTDDRRWEAPLNAGIEFSEQSAFALGIDIAGVAGFSHRELIGRFLAAVAADTPHRARLVRVSGALLHEREEMVDRWLRAFEKGIGSAAAGSR
jgi:predicted nucleotidyltransferase